MAEFKNPDPIRPTTLPHVAEELLSQLARVAKAGEIVLGGGIALKHYADFRETQDIDAWWRREKDTQALAEFAKAVRLVASEHEKELDVRSFGATESLEIRDPNTGAKAFSFQIAVRDVELDQPIESTWPPIKIETLRDNVGAKMNALVNRAAPRDFVDIFELVERRLVTAEDCWNLWQLKNPDKDPNQARLDVITALERLVQRRPLDGLPADERERAKKLREWFAAKLASPRTL